MTSSPQHLNGMIVLAGGTGKRLGGRSKPDLLIAGDRLISWTLSFLPKVPTVVVAPEEVEVPEKVFLTMEEPPGSGPAAGIVAGWRTFANGFRPPILSGFARLMLPFPVLLCGSWAGNSRR